jgi:hypothetical protein
VHLVLPLREHDGMEVANASLALKLLWSLVNGHTQDPPATVMKSGTELRRCRLVQRGHVWRIVFVLAGQKLGGFGQTLRE